jgi:hypothetical protein
MQEQTYTFRAPDETGYYTMHDGTILVPDQEKMVSTTNPGFAATLRTLGATEIVPAPAEAAPAGAPAPPPSEADMRPPKEEGAPPEAVPEPAASEADMRPPKDAE